MNVWKVKFNGIKDKDCLSLCSDTPRKVVWFHFFASNNEVGSRVKLMHVSIPIIKFAQE